MKTLKSYIFGLSALAALSAGFSACQDDIDAPAPVDPVAGIEANTTILDLKTTFWSDADNYAKTIEDADDPSHRYIIHGRVISSDQESNVFKSLVIQDETAALAFSIDAYNLYLTYRRGQEVVLDVTGMSIGKYSGLQQIGRKSYYEAGNTDQVSFMSLEYFQQYARLNGMPRPLELDTIPMASFADINTQTPEVLRKYQSQLVCFKRVKFVEGGKAQLSTYLSSGENRQIEDATGATLNVRTSGYSTFWSMTLPEYEVDLTGILSYYAGAWQIVLIDGDGIKASTPRPGSKSNPYTVEKAIADQKAGISGSGWVKGYIVGAVAPECTAVSSNEDIEWNAPTTLNNSLVIAPSADTENYEECLVVMLPSGSAFQTVGNLKTNPANLGREIMVNGTLASVMGTTGITDVTGNTDSFEIDGVDLSVLDGDGTAEHPYSVNKALELAQALSSTETLENVYATGVITAVKEVSPSFGNATYTISTTDGSASISVYRGLYLNGAKFTSADQLAVGATVVVKGNLVNYMGNTPQFAQGNSLVSYNGSTGGGDQPGPDVEPSGEGTEASPYNVAAALAAASALDASGKLENIYTTGIIKSVKQINAQYKNASYYIADEGGSTTLYVFGGKGLDGADFTSEDQLKVGAKVVVKGTLVNYMGNTPEYTSGNQLVSYDDSDVPDTPDVPDVPVGDGVAITSTALTVPGSTTIDGYTVNIEQGSGSTSPSLHAGSSAVRIYADNTITISSDKPIGKIVFDIASTNKFRYTTLTPNTGAMSPAQAAGDTSATWVGDATSVTLTVGHDATLGSDGETKRGQVHFTKLTIYPAE